MKLKEMTAAKNPVVTVTTEIIESALYPDEIRDVFTDFTDAGYDEVVDMIMISKFGDRKIFFTDEEVTEGSWKDPIFAYLYPRWRYIKQCMDYLASEYNPIENYAGTEHEQTEYDVKERRFTKGQQTDTHLEPQDVTQTVEGQHTDQITPAQKTVTTTSDKQTTTNKVSPFDGQSFVNKEETTVAGQQTGGASQVQQISSQQTADQYNYAQKTDTVTSHFGASEGYTITDTDGQRIDTDAAHKDVTTRDLTRHGNLGVMTAAQMMIYDDDFWKKFAWLDSIAHELAILLAESVWAM